MLHNDPTLLVPITLGVIFLVPWSIYGSFIVRGLMYAKSRGISLCSSDAHAQMKALRGADAYAAFLHRRARRWLVITLATWFITFAAVCLTLWILHRRGVISSSDGMPNQAWQPTPDARLSVSHWPLVRRGCTLR
jgi:hypothetical protein